MPITVDEAVRVTDRLSARLASRVPEIYRRLDYYGGVSGKLAYASDEFSEHFADRFKGFCDNWCGPVIQSCAERVNPLGIRLGDGSRAADEDLRRVWTVNEGDRGFSEAFTGVLAASRSYGLVWGSDDEPDTPVITWEHPAQAIVAHDPDTRRRRYGLKMWADIDEQMDYATLYTPDEVYKWKRSRVQQPGLESSRVMVSFGNAGWLPRETDETGDDKWPLVNPMGVVPLVELRNQTLLDDTPMSDLTGVMAMQDAINLVWAYLMNALDYASMPQRIITGADVPKVPILDKETGQPTGAFRPVDLNELIKERILWVPGADAKTAEWTAANLDAYGTVVERAVEHIAAQTRTPPHYLIAKMVNTAAESLNIAEAGLVSKAEERITYVAPSLREIYRLVALAQDDPRKADAIRSGTLLWKDVQYRSEAQRADALQKKRAMGYPLEYILELDGVDPIDIPRILGMAEREQRDAQMDELARELAIQDAKPADDEPAPAEVE